MTLAGLERRLAAMHQEKTFRAHLPFWAVFTPDEINRYIKAEEAT